MTKKKALILILSVFCISAMVYLVILIFTGLFPQRELLRVVTRSLVEKDKGKIEYWSVQKRGYENDFNRTIFDSKERIGEFEPDITEYIDFDEWHGYSVHPDTEADRAVELREIVRKAFGVAYKNIPHDVIGVRGFVAGDYIYLSADLNAGPVDPVDLYLYNINTGELIYLGGWDNVEILGITPGETSID